LGHLHEVLAREVTKDSSDHDIEHIVMDHADPTAAVGEIRDHDEIRKIF
jgi:hypothetical protein